MSAMLSRLLYSYCHGLDMCCIALLSWYSPGKCVLIGVTFWVTSAGFVVNSIHSILHVFVYQ